MRYLVYERTIWDKKPPLSPELALRFRTGKVWERQTIIDLLEAGIEVIEQQRPYFIPEYELSGKIDGKIVLNGKYYVIEIKSIGYEFDRIRGVDDILSHSSWWIRGIFYQLNTYLGILQRQGEKINEGIIILRSLEGRMKDFVIEYSEEHFEEILKKAEAIQRHLKKQTVPEPIWRSDMNKIAICLKCPYKAYCLEEIISSGEVEFNEDEELNKKVNRYLELREYVKEYEALEKEIKSLFAPSQEDILAKLERNENRDIIILKDAFIKRSFYLTTSYEIPPEVKAQYKVKKPVCRISINEL
ncbi:MAG: Dna2/Cas4 domain-containing protein [Zestosphaera sp.]